MDSLTSISSSSVAVTGEDCPAALDTWPYVKDRSSIDEIHGERVEEYRLDPRYVTADRR